VNSIEGEFHEEVLRLFALEALEWIRQIQAALLELEDAPAMERAHNLCEIILRNITNLKGSAATVELPSIGNLAFMLVPLLQHMQKDQRGATSDYYGPLRQGLGALSSVIQVLAMAETKGLVVEDLENITRRQADALQSAVAKARNMALIVEHPPPSTQSVETAPLVTALLRLNRARARTDAPGRNLAELVLRKVHAVQEVDSSTVMAASLNHIMQELRDGDERFLEEIRHRSVTIEKILRELKTDPIHTLGYQRKIREALREVARLYPCAIGVEAAEIIQFLHGLEIFLIDVLYKQVAAPALRIEAVTSRFVALRTMAQEWVDIGFKEWTELEKIFTDLFGPDFDLKKSTSSLTAR
jgi:chemotaxis protein histidine kinase CheA